MENNEKNEDWEYLEELVKESDVIVSTEGKTRKEILLETVCTNKELVRRYIEDGRDINTHYRCCGGKTLLSIACRCGANKDILKILLDNGADIDAVNGVNATSLHLASLCRNVDIVEFLLDNGANIDAVSREGSTPLQIACGRGCREIVELLIRRGANIDTVDMCECTLLHTACWEGREDVVKLLMENGVNINSVNCDNATPLHMACLKGYTDIVKLLLSNKADIRVVDNYGRSPFNVASNESITKILKVELLKREVEEEIIQICKKGSNIGNLKDLLRTTTITDDFLVKLINVSKYNVLRVLLNEFDIDRLSYVYERVYENKRCSMVNRLYKKKDIIECAEGELKKALEKKIKSSEDYPNKTDKKVYDNQRKVQDKRENDVQAKEEDNTTLIEAIMREDTIKINRLKHNIDEINRVDDNGKNALIYTCELRNIDLVKYLVKNGANVNAKDNNGKSVLMYAIEKGYEDIVDVLINHGANVGDEGKNRKSVLMYALEKGDSMLRIINSLINGLNYEDKNKFGILLIYACKGGSKSAVERIVEMIPEDEKSEVVNYNKKGMTALRMAAENDRDEVAKYLIDNGAFDYGRLRGEKLNNLMANWEKNRENNIVIEQVHSRGDIEKNM